jgi:hypothetical protein
MHSDGAVHVICQVMADGLFYVDATFLSEVEFSEHLRKEQKQAKWSEIFTGVNGVSMMWLLGYSMGNGALTIPSDGS